MPELRPTPAAQSVEEGPNLEPRVEFPGDGPAARRPATSFAPWGTQRGSRPGRGPRLRRGGRRGAARGEEEDAVRGDLGAEARAEEAAGAARDAGPLLLQGRGASRDTETPMLGPRIKLLGKHSNFALRLLDPWRYQHPALLMSQHPGPTP